MARKKTTPKVITTNYSSMLELIDTVSANVEPLTKLSKPFASLKTSSGWNGTKNIDEAIQQATTGNSELLRKMSYDKINKPATQSEDQKIGRKRQYNYNGSSVSVGRALRGLPKAMIQRKATNTTNKILNIVFFSAVLSDITTEQICNFGSVVVNDILDLERCGYRCNILHVCNIKNRYDNNIYNVVTKIKSASQPVNRNTLTFPLVSPSMLRRLIFADMERVAYFGGVSFVKRVIDEGTYGQIVHIENIEEAKVLLSKIGIANFDRAYALQLNPYATKGYYLDKNATTWTEIKSAEQ